MELTETPEATRLRQETREAERLRREARQATRLREREGLRERSAPLLADSAQWKDGRLLEGQCPRCGTQGQLRHVKQEQFVLCFPCYFPW